LKKYSNIYIPVVISFSLLLTGCEKDDILSTYNSFVILVNSGEYESAYSLTTASDNPYMSEEVFEECLYEIDDLYQGISIKKNESYWDITTSYGVYQYGYVDGRLVIDDLFTELELYAPINSTCYYNSVLLDEGLVTDNDGIEKTYTITAPVTEGTFRIVTDNYGESERIVDPFMGDTNTFNVSNEISDEIGNTIVNWVSSINTLIDANDKESLKAELLKYNTDEDYVASIIFEILTNRNINDPFTCYTNVLYSFESVDVDMSGSDYQTVTVNFSVDWTIGEAMNASMDTVGIFKISKDTGSWSIKTIDDYSFLILNAANSNVE